MPLDPMHRARAQFALPLLFGTALLTACHALVPTKVPTPPPRSVAAAPPKPIDKTAQKPRAGTPASTVTVPGASIPAVRSAGGAAGTKPASKTAAASSPSSTLAVSRTVPAPGASTIGSTKPATPKASDKAGENATGNPAGKPAAGVFADAAAATPTASKPVAPAPAITVARAPAASPADSHNATGPTAADSAPPRAASNAKTAEPAGGSAKNGGTQLASVAAAEKPPAAPASPSSVSHSNTLLPSITIIIPRKSTPTDDNPGGSPGDANVTLQLPAEEPNRPAAATPAPSAAPKPLVEKAAASSAAAVPESTAGSVATAKPEPVPAKSPERASITTEPTLQARTESRTEPASQPEPKPEPKIELAKPAAVTDAPALSPAAKPVSPGSDVKAVALSDAEEKQLAAIPLPHLPTLRSPDAAVQAETLRPTIETAAVAPAPSPRVSRVEPASTGEANAAADTPSSSSVPADIVRAELSLASDRSGLDEPQLERIRRAQKLLDSGDLQGALSRLEALNQELDAAASTYTAGRGESLWQIASKPEIFGNAYLWPLLWHANEPKLDQPWKLQRGQVLRIPKYPRLGDVGDALRYAHEHSPDGRKPVDPPPP